MPKRRRRMGKTGREGTIRVSQGGVRDKAAYESKKKSVKRSK